MSAIAFTAILAVLIILERCKKIKLANMGGSVILIVSCCVLCGLYAYEFLKYLFSILVNIMGLQTVEELFKISPAFSSTSAGAAMVILVLLAALAIPFIIGVIYIIQAIVRKPLLRSDYETDGEYSSRCSVRQLTLAIICSVCFVICLAVTVALIIPYGDMFVMSLQFLNPVLIIFVVIFTFGLALPWLAGGFLIANADLITYLTTFGLIAAAFCAFSVILGISACVRARKIGTLTTVNALIYGALCFAAGWNIIPYIILRGKIKKYSSQAPYTAVP